MARIPTRLAGPGQLTGSAVTKYTVPALTKTIIRHIHVSNPSGGAVTLTVSIGADAAGTRIFDAYSIAANSVFDHFCYYVLTNTEIVQALAGSASVLVFTMDGDEIVLG
jgi:hypothetical protein